MKKKCFHLSLWFIFPPSVTIVSTLTFTLFHLPPRFHQEYLQTSVSTILKTRAKPKPCCSFKLLNQFTLLSLPKAPNEFLHLYLSFYCFHSVPASLIQTYCPKINRNWSYSILASFLDFLVCLNSFNHSIIYENLCGNYTLRMSLAQACHQGDQGVYSWRG